MCLLFGQQSFTSSFTRPRKPQTPPHRLIQIQVISFNEPSLKQSDVLSSKVSLSTLVLALNSCISAVDIYYHSYCSAKCVPGGCTYHSVE
ncbi:hypothetical protein BST61_g8710 [Cercospora zeina]